MGFAGQLVEGGTHGFTDEFQAVEGADGRQHMGRVGTLPTACFQQPLRLGSRPTTGPAGAPGRCLQAGGFETRWDGEVEAAVGQVEAEQILPVDASANRFCGLAVREGFAELQDRHPGQAPRRQAGLTGVRVEVRKVVILKDGAQLVVAGSEGLPLGKAARATRRVWSGTQWAQAEWTCKWPSGPRGSCHLDIIVSIAVMGGPLTRARCLRGLAVSRNDP